MRQTSAKKPEKQRVDHELQNQLSRNQSGEH